MAKKYVDGEYMEITKEEAEELKALEENNTKADRVQRLAAGLSTATTLAQIRAVAQAVLEETGGLL